MSHIPRSTTALLGLLIACGARSPLDVEARTPRQADAGARDAAFVDAPTTHDAGTLDDASTPRDAAAPRDGGSDAPMRECGELGRWVVWESPTAADLFDVLVGPAGAWIVGAHGTLLRWDGAAWAAEAAPTGDGIGAIWLDAVGEGWIVAGPRFYRRAAGRWIADPPPALPPMTTMSTVWGWSADDVWFGGGSVSPAIGLFYRWNGRVLAREVDAPMAVQVLHLEGSDDGASIWALSQAGHVARSTRPGAWELLADPVSATATGVWAPSADDAFFAGASGVALRWRAGVWDRVTVAPSDVHYYAAWGSSSTNVWIAGYHGEAAHFDGATWSRSGLPTGRAMFAMDGTCATDAWMVGEAGTILRLVP